MKLPIVSRKTLERVKQNLKVINESKMALYKEFIKLQEEHKVLKRNYDDAFNLAEKQGYDIDDLKKEVARLKCLCTKNGIKYKKESKK